LLGLRGKFSSYLRKSNAYYRIKHRLRMALLYYHAELENKLVVGAANKTELSIGFFVKHGIDDAADIMPLLNLYKTQVRMLAEQINIPSNILNKSPSPDIIPGIVDEQAIGLRYEKLDLILECLEKGLSVEKIMKKIEIDRKTISKVKLLVERSEHMRKLYIYGKDN
jgi:NAD+ synthase